jgi:plastocyanin
MHGAVKTRFALGLCAMGLGVPALAGTIAGRVELLDKGGRRASDLSDVVVYVEGVPGKPTAPKTVAASIVMKGKRFDPHLAVVQVGGTVEFPNEDPIFHNAFSVSGENRFDLDLYKRPKSGVFTFQHPGIVKVYCNIHPQMSAVIVVRDNPYFTKAEQDGSFAIQGVPAGRYKLTAWQERVPVPVSAEVTVPAEGRVVGELKLDASSYKRETHLNKFGKPYAAHKDGEY